MPNNCHHVDPHRVGVLFDWHEVCYLIITVNNTCRNGKMVCGTMIIKAIVCWLYIPCEYRPVEWSVWHSYEALDILRRKKMSFFWVGICNVMKNKTPTMKLASNRSHESRKYSSMELSKVDIWINIVYNLTKGSREWHKLTRTTRTPAFWGYPPAASGSPILLSHIGSQVKRRQRQIYKFKKFAHIFKFWNKRYTRHTFWSCLIRCANTKWIQRVSLKLQSGQDSVQRRTDGRTDRGTRWNQYTPFQIRWYGGITRAVSNSLIRPYARISEYLASYLCHDYECKVGHNDPMKSELNILIHMPPSN